MRLFPSCIFKSNRNPRILIIVILLTIGLVGCIRRQPDEPASTSDAIAATPHQSEQIATFQPTFSINEISAQSQAMRPDKQLELDDLMNVPAYWIDLTIDAEKGTFKGHLLLKYENTEGVVLDSLYFRLLPNGGGPYGDGRLDMLRVIVDEQNVETEYSLNDSVLRVLLPKLLDPSESVMVEMDFEGEVSVDLRGKEPQGYGIYNLSKELLSLSGWYPILAVYDEDGWNLDPISSIGDSVYSDIAFYDVTIQIQGEYIVAASGKEVAQHSLEGNRQVKYMSGPARDFYIATSPNFLQVSELVNGVEVTGYYLPGHEEAAKRVLKIAVDSLIIFEKLFGVYPYAELDIVEAPLRYATGVEYPGIILIDESKFDEPENHILAIVTSHEVAHQWWYNVVGNDVFDDPWLDEALSTYSASLAFEFTSDEKINSELISGWENHFERSVERGGDDRITESLAHYEFEDAVGLYSPIVYSKGALFFKALREEIGDEAFFESLKRYYERYQYGIARPEDLLSVFEEVSEQSLDLFYRLWLYSP